MQSHFDKEQNQDQPTHRNEYIWALPNNCTASKIAGNTGDGCEIATTKGIVIMR